MPEGLTRRWLADAIEFMAFRGQSMAGNLIRLESALLLFEAGKLDLLDTYGGANVFEDPVVRIYFCIGLLPCFYYQSSSIITSHLTSHLNCSPIGFASLPSFIVTTPAEKASRLCLDIKLTLSFPPRGMKQLTTRGSEPWHERRGQKDGARPFATAPHSSIFSLE